MSKEYDRDTAANTAGSSKRDSAREIREMEQIEKGLEAFLQQELSEMENNRRNHSEEPQFFDINDTSGETENIYSRIEDIHDETEDIYDGIEDAYDEEEELYEEEYPDAWDDTEETEREIDVIGSSSSRKGNGRRKVLQEDFIEDWDSPRRKRTEGPSGRSGSNGERVASGTRSGSAQRSQRNGERSASGTRSGSAQRSQRNGERVASGTRSGSTQRSQSNGERGASGTRSGSAQRSQRNGNTGRRNAGRAASPKPQKKKKSRLKRFLIAVILIIVLLGAAQYYLVGVVYNKMNFQKIEALADAPVKEDGVVNILLIGNDSRENGEDGRSDAMILLSISNKTKKIYMTSLLRDMYVDIPGHDGNRLNAAYAFGGAELLMDTVEQNFDISVNRYVLVNFEAFANLVDAVGGVDLELTSEEIEYVNGYLVEYNMLTDRPQGTDNMDTSVSGLVHLNGPQALAYSRNRYLGTDFGRTERQRKVLSAVIQKLPGALVTNPKGLFDGLMPNLTTNLTQSECYQLSFMAAKLLSYDIVQSSIPVEGTYKNADIRGMAVLEVDFDANKKYLQENIYGAGVTVQP